MTLDSAAKISIVTPDITKRVKFEIDTSIKHDLSGIATVSIELLELFTNY